VLAQATTDEVLGIGRTWKALETWTFTQKLEVARELIRRHPRDERWEPSGLPSDWQPELHQEVGAALGISPVTAGKLVHLAWTLSARLPGIGQLGSVDNPGRPHVPARPLELSSLMPCGGCDGVPPTARLPSMS
jgi:hypothetical protein